MREFNINSFTLFGIFCPVKYFVLGKENHRNFHILATLRDKLSNFLFNHGDVLYEFLPQNPSFWCIPDLLNWKFSSTVKNWMISYQKSFTLVNFRSLELKIFFNHGEVWNEFFQHFLNHGETLNEFLPKILHSGAFSELLKWKFSSKEKKGKERKRKP